MDEFVTFLMYLVTGIFISIVFLEATIWVIKFLTGNLSKKSNKDVLLAVYDPKDNFTPIIIIPPGQRTYWENRGYIVTEYEVEET